MAAIPKFVVTAGDNGLSAIMDLDTNGDLDEHPLAGLTGTFTPNLKPGFYPVNGGTHLVEPIGFTVDSAGKLNGDNGVELVTAVDGVGNLQWFISFNRAYLNGKLLEIPGWWFNAREDGATVPLEELISVQKRSSLSTWTGVGRPAYQLTGGSFDEDGNLVLENADGSLLDPITPTAGTLIFIDNGDGTYDVGPLS